VADVVATVPHPGFDQSAMDGYAARHQDAVAGAILRVVGEQPAGVSRGLSVGPGEVVRVFTGAPLPAGATAVVMQEDAEAVAAHGGVGGAVRVAAAAVEGEFVRRRAEDLCVGQVLLRAGDEVTPQRVGLLASQGLACVAVGRWPAAAVVVTGDELCEPGRQLAPGQVFNSNGPMLDALLRRAGVRELAAFSCPDDPEATREVLAAASALADVVVVSGGVSVGDHDHVKSCLEPCGFAASFWRVKIKPGKPLLFGTHRSGQKLLFGLPGNPVSSFVTAVAFVLPAIRKWAGASRGHCGGRLVPCTSGVALANPGDRPHYLRGQLTSGGEFLPTGTQASHSLAGLGEADALVRVGAGAEFAAGQPLTALLL
jgi:molybdopterin molybdotransferase